MALRRFLLGAECALLKEFISLFHARVSEGMGGKGREGRRVDWSRPSNVLACYKDAVAAVGMEDDPCLPCFTYVLRQTSIGGGGGRRIGGKEGERGGGELRLLDGIEPQYLPPWPLGVVLPQMTLRKYGYVHRLLLRLHWLIHQVQRCRETVRAAAKYAASSSSSSKPQAQQQQQQHEQHVILRGSCVLLHRLSALATLLLEHVAAQIDGDCWQALQSTLGSFLPSLSPSSGDMMEDEGRREGGRKGSITVQQLKEIHADYVGEMAARCFVDDAEEERGEGEQKKDGVGEGLPSLQGEIEQLMSLISDACGLVESGVLLLLRQPPPPQQQQLQQQQYLGHTLSEVRLRLTAQLSCLGKCLRQRGVEEARRSFEKDTRGGGWGGKGVGRRGSEYCGYLLSRVEDMLEAERRCGQEE